MENFRDIILNSLTMNQVLEYYGIETKHSQFCCPFHGDKTPSAKAYRNTYYCFACGSNDTIIGFVMQYFNLDFIEAMQKLNYDFGLGLDFENQDKEKLKQARIELEKKKKKRIKEEQEYNRMMINLCDRIKQLKIEINALKNNINPFEWENIVEMISFKEEELNKLEIDFESNLK